MRERATARIALTRADRQWWLWNVQKILQMPLFGQRENESESVLSPSIDVISAISSLRPGTRAERLQQLTLHGAPGSDRFVAHFLQE
jgi:hypothetical protein